MNIYRMVQLSFIDVENVDAIFALQDFTDVRNSTVSVKLMTLQALAKARPTPFAPPEMRIFFAVFDPFILQIRLFDF